MVGRELLFFFSALGAFNGLLLSLYVLFAAKEAHFQNKFLGLLLLALSTRIGKSVFMFFSTDLSHYYIQLGLVACALIGPFLYFYIKSMKRPKANMNIEWPLHIVPIIIVLIIVCYLFPYNSEWQHWQNIIIPLINYEWLTYLLLTGYFLRKPLGELFRKKSTLSQQDSWYLNVFLGTTIIWIAYMTFFYSSYIVGALSFSLITYLLLVMMVFKRRNVQKERQVKYGNKKMAPEKARETIAVLDKIIQEEELYKNPKIKMADLAHRLEILPHTLSQILNDNFGKNFSQYINTYRIEAAKEMIHSSSHLSLEGVGKECGFNSNSTFYATFKKYTGTTPAKYKSS